ncbi:MULTISPECIES: anti-phage dCTP deaminase [unclassified Pseudoalteromonas]|uniref:anti-phage dCTP deaminase n=1 Tax=unclassified Pseudoalteromonas TaxID=194690 RepID=UPI001F3B78F4|nr:MULTISPECIES: anti-phage dCTP deaminase [unclassified Pseudoalteromonas]MCF2828665.1 deaminase [Pseudoalteromonas sp. OF5H-5]MCF2831842.1 deaminase [Pseudoalteromonas sp. DL2-H6]MCF2925163.1 deaminase [Pseudoalteromonas sp. DL2-H1]
MAEPAPQIKPISRKNTKSSIEQIGERQSKEVIIGFCGAVGAGIRRVREPLVSILEQHGYHVETIRISRLFKQNVPKTYNGRVDFDNWSPAERYTELQNIGNFFREKGRCSFPAELAVRQIGVIKEQKTQGKRVKTAFLIDQLKHPDEVKLLRLIYQNNFFMLGLYRNRGERTANLVDEDITRSRAEKIIERDKKDIDAHGQHLDKTFHLSDYFITNSGNASELREKALRFVELIHGSIQHPPSTDEKSMYAAYGAALNSVCLSRQVGASIVDKNGNVIATGFNDAPSFGGGLYSSSMEKDHRCVFKGGKCYNDSEKQKIRTSIEKNLKTYLPKKLFNLEELEKQNKDVELLLGEIVSSIYSNTRLSSLTEFSRAIHAEMEALLVLSRTNSPSSTGCTLYTTTYPCHNCARHIVAAGIERVVFIEPYEKSLALNLHSDAISESKEDGKVFFESFEGVSPRSFESFFSRKGKVKNSEGVALPYEQNDSLIVTKQFLDGYDEYEAKVTENTQVILDNLNNAIDSTSIK